MRKTAIMLALALGGTMMVAPAVQADPATDKAMDRAVENYKRNKGGGDKAKGEAMKAGQKGDMMKSEMAKGDPMRAGAKGDMMKSEGKGKGK